MLNLLLLVLVVPCSFGINPVIAKALAGHFAPGQLTLVRWLAAGLLVAALALGLGGRERWRAEPGRWPAILLLGAVGMGFCSYAAYAAVRTTAATNVALIYACTAALVVGYELATRQARGSVPLVAGVALCIAGAAGVVTGGEPRIVASLSFGTGDLWAVAGTVGWAIYTVAIRRIDAGLTALALFSVMALAGAAACLPVVAVETASFGAPAVSAAAVGWIAILVLVSSVGSYLSYSLSIRRSGPILTAAAISLTPLYAALLAMLLLGEQLAWYHGAGGALIMAGLGLINLDKAMRP